MLLDAHRQEVACVWCHACEVAFPSAAALGCRARSLGAWPRAEPRCAVRSGCCGCLGPRDRPPSGCHRCGHGRVDRPRRVESPAQGPYRPRL